MAAQNVGQDEIRSGLPPFIVKTSAPGRDQSAATLNEAAQDGSLRVGKPSEIGQNEHRDTRGLGFQVIRMYGQIRNARADERLGPASPRQLNQLVRMVSAVEVRILLRPDQADGGNRFAIDEIFLVGLMPAVDGLGDLKLPAISCCAPT